MSRVAANLKPRPAQMQEEPLSARLGRGLGQAAFFSTLLLVIARTTMPQVFRNESLPLPGMASAPALPGLATGLMLDLLCCVPALLVLARRLVDRGFVLRLSLAHLLMLSLAIWTLASVLWAADKFAALIEASHWAAALVLLWSTSQLVSGWLRLRLIAGICFGLLLVLLVQGYYYRLVDLPDTQRDWLGHREQLLRDRGVAPDSVAAFQLGKNVMSGEVAGFTLSRNTYAALLVLLMTVCAGLAAQRLADRDAAAWVICISVGLAAGLWMLYRYVQSKTAFFTPVLAAALFLLIWRYRPLLSRNVRKLFWGALVGFAMLAALIIGHGLKHGTLFHVSLTFRWQYWVGAARAFLHHPWLGVGWANFRHAYLMYRLPQAAEEPADPHNFLVRASVELGVVGGVLMIAWILRLAWETIVAGGGPSAKTSTARYPALRVALAISLAAIALNTLLSVDTSQSRDWIILELFKRFLFMLALLAGLFIAVMPSFENQELDQRPASWLRIGLIIGLGLFLLHNLIDFSMFEPGAMYLFVLLLGAVRGALSTVGPPSWAGRAAALLIFILAAVAWLCAAVGAAGIAEAEMRAQDADNLIRTSRPPNAAPDAPLDVSKLQQATRELDESFRDVPFNADYAYRAEQAALLWQMDLLLPRQLIDKAIQADPSNPQYYAARAALEVQQQDWPHVWADFAEALRLNPDDLATRMQYATLLKDHGSAAAARLQFQTVLQLNSQLAPNEIRALPPAEIQRIRKIIATLPQR